jgi:UDP-glucose 4-epimerase
MNILITGGAGFIGTNLAEFHINRGDTVVAVDDLSTGSLNNISELVEHERFTFFEADFLKWNRLTEEVTKADRIYHLAAVVGMFRVIKEPTTVIRVNVCGTERLLETAANCKSKAQIIVASSSSVYGHKHHAKELCENNNLTYSSEEGGLTGYALSKLVNEVQARAYGHEYGLRVIIPRFFNVVGPHQTGTYGFVIPRFIQQAVTGQPLTVFGDGSQIRSFCDVRDTIKMLDQLANIGTAPDAPVSAEVFNVGNTREIRIIDLAKLVINLTGSSSEIIFVPFDQAYGEHFDQITQRKPNVDKLKNLTGFTPEWSLEKTIDDLIKNNLTGGILQCA